MSLNLAVFDHYPEVAEAGLIYHADWLHDDQPIPIAVDGPGRLASVAAVRSVTGEAPAGWLSPEGAESERTP